MSGDHATALLHVLILARRQGATVRTLAKLYGCSKSTMGRLVRDIDFLPKDVLSQMGQSQGSFPQVSEGALSNLGQTRPPPRAEEAAECADHMPGLSVEERALYRVAAGSRS